MIVKARERTDRQMDRQTGEKQVWSSFAASEDEALRNRWAGWWKKLLETLTGGEGIVCFSVCLFVCLSVTLSVCLFVTLSV